MIRGVLFWSFAPKNPPPLPLLTANIPLHKVPSNCPIKADNEDVEMQKMSNDRTVLYTCKRCNSNGILHCEQSEKSLKKKSSKKYFFSIWHSLSTTKWMVLRMLIRLLVMGYFYNLVIVIILNLFRIESHLEGLLQNIGIKDRFWY